MNDINKRSLIGALWNLVSEIIHYKSEGTVKKRTSSFLVNKNLTDLWNYA